MRALKSLSFLAVVGAMACSNPSAGQADPPPLPATAAAPPAPAVERVLPESQKDVQLSLAPVAKSASQAVVNVYAKRVVIERAPMFADPFFRRFGEGLGAPRERIQQSLGSGVIVRRDGVIVTNNHVVEGADALKVVLSDRREFDAKLILADPRTDLAVLRIDGGAGLPTLAFADTRSAAVGDLVLAIGNPFGLNQTVTSGIISALARTEVGINDFSFFVQTDAAINRGNSGGALVDMNGDLVGINTAIFSQTGESNGIGFAIPAEMVRRVVESAVAGGKIVRPWLGVKGQAVTQELARSMGLGAPKGVLISSLYEGGPADRAGLKTGDIVLNVNGVEVFDEASLRYQAATQRPGSSIKLDISRNGERRTLTARADAPPRTPAPELKQLTGRIPLDGTQVVTLSPAEAEDSGLDPFASGVYIKAVARGGAAARLGLRPGDVIREVNGAPVRTTAELERALKAASGQWNIGVERNGERAELKVRL